MLVFANVKRWAFFARIKGLTARIKESLKRSWPMPRDSITSRAVDRFHKRFLHLQRKTNHRQKEELVSDLAQRVNIRKFREDATLLNFRGAEKFGSSLADSCQWFGDRQRLAKINDFPHFVSFAQKCQNERFQRSCAVNGDQRTKKFEKTARWMVLCEERTKTSPLCRVDFVSPFRWNGIRD